MDKYFYSNKSKVTTCPSLKSPENNLFLLFFFHWDFFLDQYHTKTYFIVTELHVCLYMVCSFSELALHISSSAFWSILKQMLSSSWRLAWYKLMCDLQKVSHCFLLHRLSYYGFLHQENKKSWLKLKYCWKWC